MGGLVGNSLVNNLMQKQFGWSGQDGGQHTLRVWLVDTATGSAKRYSAIGKRNRLTANGLPWRHLKSALAVSQRTPPNPESTS